MRNLAAVFKALSDETRLQMMGLLLHEQELCVCDFMEVLGVSQSKASRHLRYLANAGLVTDRREAVWVYYRIAVEPDADRAAVLRTLRDLLVAARVAGPLQSLARWSLLKQQTGPGCATPR